MRSKIHRGQRGGRIDIETKMVVINVAKIRIKVGIEFDSDKGERGIVRGVGKGYMAIGEGKRFGIGGDEEGETIGERAERGGEDGEGETRGERSRRIGGGIKKANRIDVDGRAEAGGRGRGIWRKGKAVALLSEENGVVSEMGITGEGDVLIHEKRKGKKGEMGEKQEDQDDDRKR